MQRKQIVFDLFADRNSPVFEYFSSLPEAYYQIRKFMDNHGFQHRQGSSYTSDKPMDNEDVAIFIDDMSDKLPWIGECLSALDIVNIGKQHSILETVQNSCNRKRVLSDGPKALDNNSIPDFVQSLATAARASFGTPTEEGPYKDGYYWEFPCIYDGKQPTIQIIYSPGTEQELTIRAITGDDEYDWHNMPNQTYASVNEAINKVKDRETSFDVIWFFNNCKPIDNTLSPVKAGEELRNTISTQKPSEETKPKIELKL